jgi:dihydrofolate reductase
VRKLIEVTHVALGGEIDPLDWAVPYLDDEHLAYASSQLRSADALILGRNTYEGLSAAYPTMAPNDFVDRMNAIPKYVASTTLHDARWNATIIDGDVASFVTELKAQPGQNLLKYGNGPLDAALIHENLIDEFHLLLTPVAGGNGKHLFDALDEQPQLQLTDVTRFGSGVLLLVYTPR